MLHRLKLVVISILFVLYWFTLPLTIIPMGIWWVITGYFPFMDIPSYLIDKMG